MKNLSTLLLLMAASIMPSVANAGHSKLYYAADAYRDAVVDFERQVIRSHAYGRNDVRLVDALEDSTSVLRSASRDPLSERFECAFDEVGRLQDRVASTLFGRGCPRATASLAHRWEVVTCAYTHLVEELRCIVGHRGAVVVPNVTVPRVTVPRVHVPGPVVPNYNAPAFNSPHYESWRPNAVPRAVVPEVRYPRPSVVVPTPSVYIDRTRSRTSARPSIGYSRGVHVERSREFTTPGYDRRDIGAAVVGALLSRMIQ